MANNSFKIKNSLVLTPRDLSTLVSPEAGDLACDINDSNKIKRYDAASASWVEVGSGGGVGGVDIFFVQDFESASLSSFTQTGLVLSQTDPLKGKVSAVLTHQAAINQSFKQIIPVDRKFRGESVTLSLDAKSSASQGNLVIKITNETASTDIIVSEQLVISNDVSGAKSSVTFTIPESCASLSYTITALPQAGSPVSRIDDIICQLTSVEVINSGLVQQMDSMVSVANPNGFGTTANKIRRFSIIKSQLGSDISYQDSPTMGASFTVLESGVYTISYGDEFNSVSGFGISLNSQNLTTTFEGLPIGERLMGTSTAANYNAEVAWTGVLSAGDVVRPHTTGAANGDTGHAYFIISRQGSLKQVTVNSNQKAVIPTSELRFEGATARGSTDTAIVLFSAQTLIRGDAFSVSSTAANGTVVTILKPGRLVVSAGVYSNVASVTFSVSKNQAVRTAVAQQSEVIATGLSVTANSGGCSGVVDVVAGDVIRVSSTVAPTTGAPNFLQLSLQEQSIQVSVSNTLPQFSESDSSVRVSGANGFGSTATTTRRFASVAQNIGSAIQYVDSATLGGQFIAQEAGIYTISYTENSTANVRDSGVFIRVNGAAVAYDNQIYNTASADNKVASASWTGYLNQGDVVTGTAVSTNNGADAVFTISKVGKPNVTGVNVTPFITTAFDVGQIGEVKAFAGNVDSTYFLVCDGRAVSRTSYADLFRAIGTTHGQGDGSTTFNLPDYRGRFLRGTDAGAGRDPDRASRTAMNTGGNSGDNVGSVQGSAVPNITGTISTDTTIYGGTGAMYPNGGPGRVGTAGANASIIGFDANRVSSVYQSTTEARPINANVNYGIRWKAAMDMVLSPTQTFSTDTAALTYAGSGTYTLSTLSNAPVGTFITFTYAANTNTRTQTTTAPTQTTADMNTNGILLYPRAYTAASTAAQPAVFAIQIGKGLKGVSRNLYKAAGKVTAGTTDLFFPSTSLMYGAQVDYNENTGILVVDAGFIPGGSATTHAFIFTDSTDQTSGYLVINASTNPALTGMNLSRVAARATNTSGQTFGANDTIMTYNSTKIFDTHNALNTTTGLFTAPETGYYLVEANAFFASRAYTAGVGIYIRGIKNGAYYNSGAINTITTSYTGNAPAGKYSSVVFLSRGDTFGVSVWNDAGTASLFTSISEFNSISITKVSI